MAGRRSLVRKDLRWHDEESTTARLSRGITDQLGKSLETRPFAVQRPAKLQDRHRNPVRKEILLDAIPATHRLAILADLGVTTPERIKALENAAKARGIMVSTHVANRAVAL